MPVVDASVLVEYLSDGEHAASATERLLAESHAIWAPALIDAEVGHVLRREVRRGNLDEEVAGEALWQLGDLPVRRVPHDILIHYAWTLRHNVSFYDALYVALAEMLNEPLITFDARLGRSGVDAKIEVLAGAA
jgi:predicted nucleic acid-binding protein